MDREKRAKELNVDPNNLILNKFGQYVVMNWRKEPRGKELDENCICD